MIEIILSCSAYTAQRHFENKQTHKQTKFESSWFNLTAILWTDSITQQIKLNISFFCNTLKIIICYHFP